MLVTNKKFSLSKYYMRRIHFYKPILPPYPVLSPCVKKLLVYVLVFTILFILFYYHYYIFTLQDDYFGYGHKSSNYFSSGSALRYVVNTATCKIPNLNPFDTSILPYLEPSPHFPVDCHSLKSDRTSWVYTNKTELILNITAITASGYSLNTIHCCYRIIERVEQPLSDYNLEADLKITYSEKCHPITKERQQVDAEFIRVHCISKTLPFYDDVIYRNFFAIVQPNSDRLVSWKLSKWNRSSYDDPDKPPNVIIVGIDTNSRMNSHRNLNKTLALLRDIGAVEMLGYTKNGENTFPNTAVFLTGQTEQELMSNCLSGSGLTGQDDCPYIWKDFDKAGYLTVAAEDTPYIGVFNFLRTGFVRKPTDFYLRPFILAVYAHTKRKIPHYLDCIGHDGLVDIIFKYVLDIMDLASGNGAPVFAHTWMSSCAHRNYNNLRYWDTSLEEFISGLVKYKNTIVFFMSDHGVRYGGLRKTPQGWYEDKLPTQWIYMTPDIRDRYPEWYSSVKDNANRLTSHTDLYKTFLHVLNASTVEGEGHQKGHSLFTPVPLNRTCEDAAVPINYCPCSKPEVVPVEGNADVQVAAEVAVEYLTKQLPLDLCETPELKRIISASVMKSQDKSIYVVGILTTPGNFEFEANVEKEGEGRFVVRTELLRMNKLERAADCVTTPILETYCYCK